MSTKARKRAYVTCRVDLRGVPVPAADCVLRLVAEPRGQRGGALGGRFAAEVDVGGRHEPVARHRGAGQMAVVVDQRQELLHLAGSWVASLANSAGIALSIVR